MKGLLASSFLWIPAILIALTWSASPEKYADITRAVPMVLGIHAWTWLTGEILLAARLKFIERWFGLDRMFRFHGVLGVAILAILYVHKLMMEFAMGESLKTQVGDIAFFTILTLSVLSVFLLSGMAARWFKWAARLKKKVEAWKVGTSGILHAGSFEWQKLVHNLMVAAYTTAFIHILLVFTVRSHPAQLISYVLMYAAAMTAWVWHRFVRPALQRAEAFVVTENVLEAEGVRTIRMKPEHGGVRRHRMSGQFAFFTPLSGAVKSEEHPFSLSSAPSADGTLSITAKALGDFTATLGEVKAGDRIRVDGPYGRFSPEAHPEDARLVFVAGGIGITPMIGMLEHLLTTDPERPVLLIWGLNHRRELIRKDLWPALEAGMPNFRFVPVWFRDPDASGEQGIIDREKIERLMKEHHFDRGDSGFYVCGPGIMLEGTLKALAGIGVPKGRIRHERFAF